MAGRMENFVYWMFLLLPAHFAFAQMVNIDITASKVTVQVSKSGLFSAFAHNHTIAAPLASGHIDLGKKSVELMFHTQDMKVMDPEVKDSDRAQIERTMKSEAVLDVTQFPEIGFVSKTVEVREAGRFLVHGDLTLHGVTKSIDLPVSLADDRYKGSVKLKQTDFGITPVKIAGGTVRVKDEIEIVFEIVPSK
jgi:polyisoprenoid-binding protein YceI